MITIITIISFILQFILNRFLYNSLFIPLTILVTLTLEPRFNKNKNKYHLYAFLIGLLYDYLYTNTFFLNAGIFLILSFVIRFMNHNIPNNIIRPLINVLAIIILYRTLIFFLYFIIGITKMDIIILLKSIYKSLIFNIMYGYLLYIPTRKNKNKSI